MRFLAPALLLVSSQPVLSQTLYQALSDAGAAQFAVFIQSDPELAALYESGRVRTIFAPTDDCPRWNKRQGLSPEDQQRARLHVSGRETSIQQAVNFPSIVFPTEDDSANLGGENQRVVAELPRRASNATANVRRAVARDQPPPPSLYRVMSGLGASVNVIRADIPYDTDNGTISINIVDDFFTIPTSLSDTSRQTGQTTFVSLANGTNQTASLDSLAQTTYFVPSNEAFASAGLSAVGTGIANLLGGHVIPNFVGYLPDLTDGLQLTDRNGNNVTIHIRNQEYFVGEARIIRSNQILENGVAHVIDRVLTAGPVTVPGNTAAGPNRIFWPTALQLFLSAIALAI